MSKENESLPRRRARPGHGSKEEHRRERDEDCDRPGLRKVVERTWYFRDDDCDDGRDEDCGRGGDDCDEEGKPGRPRRPPGTSSGTAGPGAVLTTGTINQPDQPGVWGGPRSDLQLPYLFMRANAGDLGVHPVVNAPFWESPDIFILAGVDPASAPDIPPALGQVAQAGQPNTIYAHVWNFGNASANEVLVEFYWVNPALGISADSVNLIAQTVTAIGAKGSGNAHVMVKCPEAWVPTFVNGGHECLLVRVWDNPSDLPGQPPFDASWNRHVAQRNIHVNARGMTTGGALGLKPAGFALQQPILIKVGPLFGAPATVAVERVAPKHGALASTADRNPGSLSRDGDADRNACRLPPPRAADSPPRAARRATPSMATTSTWHFPPPIRRRDRARRTSTA